MSAEKYNNGLLALYHAKTTIVKWRNLVYRYVNFWRYNAQYNIEYLIRLSLLLLLVFTPESIYCFSAS